MQIFLQNEQQLNTHSIFRPKSPLLLSKFLVTNKSLIKNKKAEVYTSALLLLLRYQITLYEVIQELEKAK